jgi:hypothetical protein
MKPTKTFIIDEELAKPFALAAEGNPYFVLVQIKDGVYSTVSEGFALEYVLNWLVDYAKENELGDEFKQAVSDLLLDLSKEL